MLIVPMLKTEKSFPAQLVVLNIMYVIMGLHTYSNVQIPFREDYILTMSCKPVIGHQMLTVKSPTQILVHPVATLSHLIIQKIMIRQNITKFNTKCHTQIVMMFALMHKTDKKLQVPQVARNIMYVF